MKCPSCGAADSTKVIDSRPVEESNSIRRRRECLLCQFLFTTYEVIEEFQTVVVKKNGNKELFDRSKLLRGIMNACHKRPVDADAVALEIVVVEGDGEKGRAVIHQFPPLQADGVGVGGAGRYGHVILHDGDFVQQNWRYYPNSSNSLVI